jgi:hypothetical protein
LLVKAGMVAVLQAQHMAVAMVGVVLARLVLLQQHQAGKATAAQVVLVFHQISQDLPCFTVVVVVVVVGMVP